MQARNRSDVWRTGATGGERGTCWFGTPPANQPIFIVHQNRALPDLPQSRRFGARSAAASAVGALALPASAQSIDAPDVHLQFASLIVPGGERDFGAIEIDFGSHLPAGTRPRPARSMSATAPTASA